MREDRFAAQNIRIFEIREAVRIHRDEGNIDYVIKFADGRNERCGKTDLQQRKYL